MIWPASAVHTGLKWEKTGEGTRFGRLPRYSHRAEVGTEQKWLFPVLSCFLHHPCRPNTSSNFSQKAFSMSFESWNLCISYVVPFPIFSNIRYIKNVVKTSLICIACIRLLMPQILIVRKTRVQHSKHNNINASTFHYPKTGCTSTTPISMPQLFIIQKQSAHPQHQYQCLNMLTVDPIPVKPTAKGFTQPKAEGRFCFLNFFP